MFAARKHQIAGKMNVKYEILYSLMKLNDLNNEMWNLNGIRKISSKYDIPDSFIKKNPSYFKWEQLEIGTIYFTHKLKVRVCKLNFI